MDRLAMLEQMVAAKPDYVPCYLMHGNLLEAMGRPKEAAAVYDKGITAAEAASDEHAVGELTAARQALD